MWHSRVLLLVGALFTTLVTVCSGFAGLVHYLRLFKWRCSPVCYVTFFGIPQYSICACTTRHRILYSNTWDINISGVPCYKLVRTLPSSLVCRFVFDFGIPHLIAEFWCLVCLKGIDHRFSVEVWFNPHFIRVLSFSFP